MSEPTQDGGYPVTAKFPWSFASSIGQWFLATIVAFLGMSFVQVALLLAVQLATRGLTLSADAKALAVSIVLTLSYGAGFGAAAAMFAGQFRKHGLSMADEMSINLKSLGGSWGKAFKMAGLGLLAIFALNALLQFLPLPKPDSPAGDMAIQFKGLAYLIFAFSGVVFAPILEEILFRGYLLNALRIGFRAGIWAKMFRTERIADYAAIAVSAAIFALAHGTLTGFPPLFCAGIVMAALYRRSGSLVPSMLLHFMMNSLAFITLYLQTVGH
jgi:membrane protease YdiL (CAAX protease family)